MPCWKTPTCGVEMTSCIRDTTVQQVGPHRASGAVLRRAMAAICTAAGALAPPPLVALEAGARRRGRRAPGLGKGLRAPDAPAAGRIEDGAGPSWGRHRLLRRPHRHPAARDVAFARAAPGTKGSARAPCCWRGRRPCRGSPRRSWQLAALGLLSTAAAAAPPPAAQARSSSGPDRSAPGGPRIRGATSRRSCGE